MYLPTELLSWAAFTSLWLADPAPQAVLWNKAKTYGPDGPWQAVSIGIGTDPNGNTLDTVDVFPAGWIFNRFITADYCHSSPPCPASPAGLYHVQNSTSVYTNVSDVPGLVWSMGSQVLRQSTGNASVVLDILRLNTTGSPITILNSSIDTIHGETVTFHDGSTYPPSVGFLALGSLNKTRSYARGVGEIGPNYLFDQGIIPSASLGLHCGSARVGPEGSLVWGGYDQSRVIGDVGTFPFDPIEQYMRPSLIDIQVGTEIGASPFPSQPTAGLLKVNNSLGSWQPAILNPTLPFLYLTPETCSNIARLLPVTLLPQKGVYLWNTSDARYQRIVNSPAYLAFTFQPPASSSSNLTIKIPFRLLDLTLEYPILGTPQQYFPCSPYDILNETMGIFLGRSFLQGTFLGANSNQSTYFLAQAPGPDADAPDIQTID